MSHSFDVTKARTLMYYLGKAGEKIEERKIAREKVKAAIKRLKTISTKTVQKDIQELEKRIAQALVMEKRIKSVQSSEEAEHNELIDKIDMLQERLAKFMDASNARKERMQELELKILKATQPKVYEIVKAKEFLLTLEKEYQAEKADGNHNKAELILIEKKIKDLKSRVKALEAELN